MNMLAKRIIKSLINWLFIVPFINIILFVLGKKYSLGSLVTGIKTDGSKRLMYGLGALIQVILYGTIICWIITIILWIMNSRSIAERISGVTQS